MKPALQSRSQARERSRWHDSAGDDKLSITKTPPPRSGGKPSVHVTVFLA